MEEFKEVKLNKLRTDFSGGSKNFRPTSNLPETNKDKLSNLM
jgi:hypothetical protein